jgi:hypothetical protein
MPRGMPLAEPPDLSDRSAKIGGSARFSSGSERVESARFRRLGRLAFRLACANARRLLLGRLGCDKILAGSRGLRLRWRRASHPAGHAHAGHILRFRTASIAGSSSGWGVTGCGLHLKRGKPRVRTSRSEASDAYFVVVGLDGILDEYRARGARIIRVPEVTAHGFREIDVVDRDGYVLCFGEDLRTT